MDMIADLIEKKIQEAMAKGEFKNLEGEGKPLDLNDDAGVPNEHKVAFRVLKNSGFLPPEVELSNAIVEMKAKLVGIQNPQEKEELQKKIVLKETALSIALERMRSK